ncbi:putative C-14 sterol reductase [Whalleya microplaca]|nr:putative C-14 sterol reductase [Whalleya microplaca]
MASHSKTQYEFGGPFGAAAIITGLPRCFSFACNDVTGCPVPSLLEPRTLTWDNLRADMGWPNGGIRDLGSWQVTGVVLAYYLLSLILWRILPAHEVYGTKLLRYERPLTYHLNYMHVPTFLASIVQLAICAIGRYLQGAEFVTWTYITDKYVQLWTSNITISIALSILVYIIRSFGVDTNYPNGGLRELAAGGNTGNFIYDFYIGRELNPPITLPVFGQVDIKTWCEMRPGLTGWMLLDLAFVAKQYRTYGYVSDSIIFTALVQIFYALDGQFMETGILTMMDITTDGFGFMLSFGDLVWVPFLYSTQCRYLSVYPLKLGWAGIAAVAVIFFLGLYIFRAANIQKNLFRTRPNDPSVSGFSYIQTKRGTKLLTAGWWGMSRHINYFGDWLQATPFSIPTGLAGYTILPASGAATAIQSFKMVDGRAVVQGQAKGWGIFFTYFYVLYFAILLMHQERRDDAMCLKKYGEDWEKYRKIVRWRIVPGLY